MTAVQIDSFAPSELSAFVTVTQGSAKPPPGAKFSYAFGVYSSGFFAMTAWFELDSDTARNLSFLGRRTV